MYTTATKVREYTSVGSMTDEVIEGYIAVASKEMDRLADRKLGVDELESGDEAPYAYYNGNGEAELAIDDVFDIEEVALGDEYGENFSAMANVIKYPKVAPHNKLLARSGYFAKGVQNVRVKGMFGLFETIPADLEFACTVITAGMINNKNSAGEIKSESIGNYSVSYVTDSQGQDYKQAIDTIATYRKVIF
jgi:hypothetical protein